MLTHNGAPQPEPKPVQVAPGDAGAPDLTPITIGDVFENPVTGERSVILERPWDNPEGRLTSEHASNSLGRAWWGNTTTPLLSSDSPCWKVS